MNKKIILFITTSLLTIGLSSCSHFHFSDNTSSLPPPSASNGTNTALTADHSIWQANTQTTWNKLQYIPLKTLENSQTTDPTMTAWINLAIISKRYSTNTSQLTQQLIAWRQQNPSHPANQLFPDNATLENLQKQSPPHHVALLLPLQGPYKLSGQAVREGFLGAYYKASAKNQPAATILFYDTSNNPNILALYQQAVTEGADVVIGPLLKDNVQTLINQGNITTPVLALNYTDIGFSSLPTNLYQFGLSPNDEAQQLADKAKEAGLSRAILIAPKSEWGESVAKTLTARWQSLGGSITDTFFFSSESNLTAEIPRLLHIDPHADQLQMKADNNKQALQQQRRQDFDTIFLLAPPVTARQIVPLLRYYYIENTPIYSTSVIYSGMLSPQKDGDLNGVIFSDTPWTLQIAKTPPKHALFTNRLYAVGRDSYLLSQNLNRLTKLSNFPIYGATGALTLTPQHQLYRRLAWTKFNEGRP